MKGLFCWPVHPLSLFPSATTSVKYFEQQFNWTPWLKKKRRISRSRSAALFFGEKAHGTIRGQAGSVLQCSQKGKYTMPLMQILLALIVVGVLLWLVNRFIPMQGTIKSILNAVVVIGVVLWLLDAFGLFHSLSRIRVGT